MLWSPPVREDSLGGDISSELAMRTLAIFLPESGGDLGDVGVFIVVLREKFYLASTNDNVVTFTEIES